MFPVVIRDPNGSAQRISKNGEAASSSLAHSEPFYVQLAVDNQIYNIVPGLPGKRFVLSGLLLATSRNITGEKAIHVYEATALDDAVHAKDILTIDMVKADRLYLPLIDAITQNGAYINAHAEDSEVNITIFGYYVNA